MNDHKDLREMLMELDREFDRVTAQNGADGWVSFFAEDGVMLPGGDPIIGKQSIYEAMDRSFSRPGFSLRWEPLTAKISSDGCMGFTYGNYVRTSQDSEGNVVTATGMYTSIWEKRENGEWKIVLDMGN